jgi:sugar lactone lactonase YvrE
MTTMSERTVPLEAIEAYEVIEPKPFARLRGEVGARRLADGQRWAEGPVYVPAGRLWVPRILSRSCGERVFVDDAADAVVSADSEGLNVYVATGANGSA